MNTQRLYHFNRKQLNTDTNKNILEAEKIILYSLPLILIIGVVDYYMYKKNQLGNQFQYYLFILGNAKCRRD
jgi:hypothetical protein